MALKINLIKDSFFHFGIGDVTDKEFLHSKLRKNKEIEKLIEIQIAKRAKEKDTYLDGNVPEIKFDQAELVEKDDMEDFLIIEEELPEIDRMERIINDEEEDRIINKKEKNLKIQNKKLDTLLIRSVFFEEESRQETIKNYFK